MPDTSAAATRIASFTGGLRSVPPPAATMALARQSLIDWVAVGLAARDDPEGALVASSVHGWGSQGRAIAFDGTAGAPAPVALINGTFAHALDYDDFHIASVHHAGGPTFAAVVALAMDRGMEGADLFRGFVAGFEVGTRLGMSGVGLDLAGFGWHPTCILGHLSAAVGAAALLGFDADTLDTALGFGAGQAGGQMATAGTIAKPFLVGKAAMGGVIAAELAERGASVPKTLLDPGKGMLATLLRHPAPAPELDTLGREWETARNTFKPFSSCQLTHAPIDVARSVRSRIDPRAIQAVRVVVNPFALTIAGIEAPRTPLEGRFSIKHCVAMALIGRGAGPADFSAEALTLPDVAALRRRIEIVTSESMARTAASIEVDLGDRTEAETLPAVLGSLERPMTAADTEAKFRDAVRTPAAEADALYAALGGIERPGALAEVTAILAGSTGPR